MARITVVEKVYFQPEVEQPVLSEGSFGRRLYTPGLEDVQVYNRKSTIGQDPKPLDYGWMDPTCVGTLLLVNREGDFSSLPKIPTKEYMENALRRVIDLMLEDGTIIAVIPPTESCRFTPDDLSKFRIRCRHEQAKFSIHVFPGDSGGYREVVQSPGEYKKTHRTDH